MCELAASKLYYRFAQTSGSSRSDEPTGQSVIVLFVSLSSLWGMNTFAFFEEPAIKAIRRRVYSTSKEQYL